MRLKPYFRSMYDCYWLSLAKSCKKEMSSGKNWLVWKERLKRMKEVQKSKTFEGWKNWTLLDLKTVKDKREMF